MIPRRLEKTLISQLSQFPAVALLGPRQVGKTTLARSLPNLGKQVYLDLENPGDQEKLSDPWGYLSAQKNSLIIIDEVQRFPGLFPILRGIIDARVMEGQRVAQFLLLGSASLDLLRQSTESLAGRIAYLELSPLEILEIPKGTETELWIRGGFPRSFLAESEKESVDWRANFITTYLERDIPLLGPRIPAETLRRLWTMLSHNQGCLFNASEMARSLGVDGKSITKYLDLLVGLLLVRRLKPFHGNIGKRLVKSPKTFVRDSGLVHTLLRLDSLELVLGHPVAGLSWEGFVVENLIRSAPARTEPSFYRTQAGAEIDLILELPGGEMWAFEIKRNSAPKLEKGFRIAQEDLKPTRSFLVYPGTERFPKGPGTEVIGVRQMVEELERLG